MALNYKNIIDDLAKVADKNKFINSFGTGDITQLISLTQQKDGVTNTDNSAPIYPLMYVIPNPVNRAEQFLTYSFTILVCDILNTKNYDIEVDLYSDTLQIMEDVLAQFKYSVTSNQGDYEEKYDIVLPTTINPFSEAYDDYVTGWNMNLQIVVDSPLNRCIAPFEDFE